MLFTTGRSIREARKRQNVTQSEAAKAAGIGRSSLSQIESGTIQEIGIRKVIRVLDFLGLELTTRPRGAPPTLEELRALKNAPFVIARRPKADEAIP